MALIERRCKLTQGDALHAMADQGNLVGVRQHLTAMLRCSGQLGCAEAVPCSDQAVELLRRLVLPTANA